MPTVLTLTPATRGSLTLNATQQGSIYPSAHTYPSGGTYPGSYGLTLTAASSGALTLTPA